MNIARAKLAHEHLSVLSPVVAVGHESKIPVVPHPVTCGSRCFPKRLNYHLQLIYEGQTRAIGINGRALFKEIIRCSRGIQEYEILPQYGDMDGLALK